MEELLQIHIIGIEDAIVVPAVLANDFELKTELLDFISNNPFFGLENDDPHSHIKRFYQITRTFKINQVPHDVMKLILFPFSLKGAAETWLENEPPYSITNWNDLVSKFLNRFYPHSKTREFRKEITNFLQVFGETFTEAWERFKDLLRKCPYHGFSPFHQIDFFYNWLSQSDQDSLNTAAGGNLISKNTQEALSIIENKSKRPLGVLPSDTKTYLREVRKAITTMSGLTLDGSFIPHSNFLVYQEEEQEPETITEVVKIPSSQSTPLVPPPETPPLSSPRPKKNLEPNPHQPLIPYPSRLQEEKIQTLENPTGCADHFVYRIDIVDSFCDKFPIENNSLSGNTTPSYDSIVESLSPLPTSFRDSDSLLEETDTFLSNFDDFHLIMRHFALISKRRVVAVPLLIPIILFQTTKHSVLMSIISKRRVVAVPLSHSDRSLLEYESFHFDLSIDLLPPANRSDFHHEEFSDEVAHIISSLEYDWFYFDIELDPGELTILFEENISEDSTKELTSHELNDFLSSYPIVTPLFLKNFLKSTF
ncbi:reverse transcriptase domain-containing protein [Tanacetum coccineum]